MNIIKHRLHVRGQGFGELPGRGHGVRAAEDGGRRQHGGGAGPLAGRGRGRRGHCLPARGDGGRGSAVPALHQRQHGQTQGVIINYLCMFIIL